MDGMDDQSERDEKAEKLKTIERLNAGVEERLAMFEKARIESDAMLQRIWESTVGRPLVLPFPQKTKPPKS